MADLTGLLGESPLGCERVQRSLGRLSSPPKASAYLPQKEERTGRVGAQTGERGLTGDFWSGRVTRGQGTWATFEAAWLFCTKTTITFIVMFELELWLFDQTRGRNAPWSL